MENLTSEYNRKRNFDITSEPKEEKRGAIKKRKSHGLRFVIQKHDARRLHYDFRLELDGTLKSWAIPKGPSLDPRDKRLAVHVEDHPLGYASFEGSIPHGQYGAGDVIVWDQGIWQPHDDPASAYHAGKLKFSLIGEKLSGDWTLVRTHLRGSGDKEQWLLIKERDQVARNSQEYDIVMEQPQSVLSGALVGGVINSRNKFDVKKREKKSNTSVSAKPDTKPEKKPIKKSDDRNADISVSVPEQFSPELATLVTEPPEGEWLYEIKFDGYRILARVRNGDVRMFTRNGHDWTDRLPEQAKAIAGLKLKDSWLDGEVVVLNDQGLPSFQALQNAFDIKRSQNVVFYLFDAPFLNGRDLREEPLEVRRELLQKSLDKSRSDLLRYSNVFTAHHRDIVASACAMSLEGIIGKRAGSTYVSRRSADWIKLKCRLRQEFIIVGYSKPQGSRSGFGALLLGIYADQGSKELLYAGRVGTGFNAKSLQQIHERLQKLERDKSPLTKSLGRNLTRDVTWLKPALVCEVEFAEWTGEGALRQAAFIALRSDKPAKDIIREQARSPLALKELEVNRMEKDVAPQRKSKIKEEKDKVPREKTPKEKTPKENASVKSSKNRIADINITHPERVIDPESGAHKIDLAQFYDAISEWALPHLKNRPVSLLRCPDGITGEQFFQKHSERLAIPNITQLDRSLDPGHAQLMAISSVKALVGAVQMGTVEFHTWGATSNQIENPDRIILDLDPDPALPWRSMIEATRLTLAVLDELKLDSYLKTSGGKGMHIIIPLARKFGWEEVKLFAKAISEFMAKQIPERFVAKMGPKNRIGKIFIDYLRNGRGASTVAAYSVRARPGLPVSVPITHEELLGLTSSAQWHIENLMDRLEKQTSDPWDDYKNRQGITRAMWKKLGVKDR
jgi:bifunctional non-homologous end joining protein LigD